MPDLTMKPLAALIPVVGFVLGGCEAPSAPDGSRPPAYPVYSAVLQQVILADGWGGDPRNYEDRRPIELLVISAEVDSEVPEVDSDFARTKWPPLERATVADFRARTPGRRFEMEFEGVGAYRLVSPDEWEALFGLGGWPRFYERFPSSPGLIGFSKVGFNRDETQAIVYMVHVRAGLWGNGSFYLLTKQEAGWQVVGRLMRWES